MDPDDDLDLTSRLAALEARAPATASPPSLPERARGGKESSTSVHQSTPPEHGFVIPGSLLDDGQGVMVADQRDGVTGVGDCSGEPMP